MGATARNSVLYTSLITAPTMARPQTYGGVALVPLMLKHTVVAGGESGASADTVNLTILPANWTVIDGHFTTDGVGASAGANVTAKVGDSGDDDRYFVATDFDAANAIVHLAHTGVQFTPTADTIIVLIWGTLTAQAGKIVKGTLMCVPPNN